MKNKEFKIVVPDEKVEYFAIVICNGFFLPQKYEPAYGTYEFYKIAYKMAVRDMLSR